MVTKVVAAANAELKDLHLLTKFAGGVIIPAGKLQGFPEKRRNYQPDLSACHNGEILIKYLQESSTATAMNPARARMNRLHSRFAARVKQAFRHTDRGECTELVNLPSPVSFRAALQMYQEADDVEYAQPNYLYSLHATPNDALWGDLWGMRQIQAPAAWDVRTNSDGVIVAQLDPGAYTVIPSGTGGSTGVGLIEINEY